MHKIFITEGVVLGKSPTGEGSARVMLLTRELGLLRASARSARLERSKLRYGLGTLTMARYSLVRGVHEWRLTGVEQVRPLPSAPAARIAKLLLRLIHGEEPVLKLFDDVAEGFALLAQDSSPSLETILVLRILSHLGYLPHTDALAPFVEGEFSVELSAKALESRSLLIRTINESLHATGL